MKGSKASAIAILIMLYASVFVLSFSIGRYPVHPVELMKILDAVYESAATGHDVAIG